MTKVIKDDVESGAHGKWEKLYKKICDAINKSLIRLTKAAHLVMKKMDYSILYAKV
jgi:hypothetical protein